MLVSITGSNVVQVYHGSAVPVKASLLAVDDFDSDGVRVAKGSLADRSFRQDFTASVSGNGLNIATGPAYSTTGAPTPGKYILVFFDAGDNPIYALHNIQIPAVSPTTWASILAYSDGVGQASQPPVDWESTLNTLLAAHDATVVHNSGDETVNGIKTFVASPIVPTPTTNFQAATKKYVDDHTPSLTGVVLDTGNQTVGGIKTFTASPVVPTPTTDLQAATKGYVDDFAQRLFAVEFDGSPQSIELGPFYPNVDVPIGDCFYETWLKLTPGSTTGKYDFSAGFGGAHAMLRDAWGGNFVRGSVVTGATNASPIVVTTDTPHGLSTGAILYIRGVLGNTAANQETPNITVISPTTFSINGSTGNGAYTSGGFVVGNLGFGEPGVVSFGADDVPYEGQWAHSAVGVDHRAGAVFIYYDGIPVGYLPFLGHRACPNLVGLENYAYIGGSDHSNYVGRLSQYRIFEGANPRAATVIQGYVPYLAFAPHTGFGNDWQGTPCNLLYTFFQPQQVITDQSAGLPVGTTHAGRIRGTANGILQDRSTYPSPQFVVDNDVPNNIAGVQPVQPAGKVYTPSAVPSGAIVFDSIQRKNSTFAFDGNAGIGSTEGGTRGPLAWHETLLGYPYFGYPLGILNEQFVYTGPVANGVGAISWVDALVANQDIRVSRKTTITFNCGVSTSILFRYQDDNNYWYAFTHGTSGNIAGQTSQKLFVGKVVAGVTTQLHRNVACPATSWEVLRVTTKSDGSYAVFCDATSVVSGSDAQHAAQTKSGIIAMGDPQAYGVGCGTYGLTHRWRNFTILPNP